MASRHWLAGLMVLALVCPLALAQDWPANARFVLVANEATHGAMLVDTKIGTVWRRSVCEAGGTTGDCWQIMTFLDRSHPFAVEKVVNEMNKPAAK